MELQDLQGFDAVLRTGSFSRAAAATGRTQPAVSLQVARLERELGVRLLDRSGRTVRPTREGEALANLGREILERVQAAAQIGRAEPTGELVVGAGQAAAAALLPRALPRFRRRFPGVGVRVHTDDSRRLLDGIAAGRVDLAILSAVVQAPGVQVRPFRRYGFVAVGGGLNDPLILPEAGSTMGTHIRGALLAAGIAPRVALETSSVHLAVALARAGVGTAVVPAFAATGKRLDRWVPRQSLSLAWRTATSDLPRDTLADYLAGNGTKR